MNTPTIRTLVQQHCPDTVDAIRREAHQLHASVNQQYDDKPYAVHLDMVADTVLDYGHVVDINEVLPVVFGAYFHDSIEDARLTYNNVLQRARQHMDDHQALLAAEIVYALTNDKGRTRAERAGDAYYAGIRQTPYAAMVKLADRIANYGYSLAHADKHNGEMRHVYTAEMPHFLASIAPDADNDDPRKTLPEKMLKHLYNLSK